MALRRTPSRFTSTTDSGKPSPNPNRTEIVERPKAQPSARNTRSKPKALLTQDSASLDLSELTRETLIGLYKASVLTQIGLVKTGLGANDAKAILGRLHVAQGDTLAALRIPAATINRKAKTNLPLALDEGERVLGLGRLLGQVQAMVEESGNPEAFDAATWLSEWISAPVPALGGARPLDLMDTMTGQGLVSQVLAQMQSGAYA